MSTEKLNAEKTKALENAMPKTVKKQNKKNRYMGES